MSAHAPLVVVAVVPAFESDATVSATVRALVVLDGVDEVLVVDDASPDGTAQAAQAAGARVLRLPDNRGKGGAVAAAVHATPDADVYLLVDADVGATASAADALLAPVVAGDVDLAIGVLPDAGRRGGFGRVKRVAAWGIRRACGFEAAAPLSGQRVVRAPVLRDLSLAPGFGLETAMTIDAVRSGARVREVPVDMDHRHTGRLLAGFAHRGRQGVAVSRALWPRLTTSTGRIGLIIVAAALALGAALWSGSRWQPSSVAPPAATTAQTTKVVIVGVRGLTWDDLRPGVMPNLDALADRGAVGALTVRTLSDDPHAAEAYVTLGAGARSAADPDSSAVDVAELRERNRSRRSASLPGALGEAARAAGSRTGAVALGALAVMDSRGKVDVALPDVDVARVQQALVPADVVVVDTGPVGPAAADAAIGGIVEALPPDTLLVVAGVTPPGAEWRLTPVMATGPGTVHGYLTSPSTKRLGLVTLTDLAPTALAALGEAVPEPMVGHALRYHADRASTGDRLARLERLDRDATFRERVYYPVTLVFVVVQSAVYLLAIILYERRRGFASAGPWLRVAVVAFAAWPLATFAFRAAPGVAGLGGWGLTILVALDAAITVIALRARRHPLAPLGWVCGLTAAILLLDVASGARLQTASLMGYSPHTAARFYGIGNVAFATLAASAILAATIHLERVVRRREALVAMALFFTLVVVVDGLPSLGDDVGGVITLVPVLALALWAFAGRRVTWRTMAGATALGLVALATVTTIDLLRPDADRTHLGRFMADVFGGRGSQAWDTVARKAEANLRVLQRSVWTWAVPAVTAFLLYLLVWRRRATDLLPPGSPARVGVVAALAAGLLGFAVNDSGVIVTAVVFVFVAPFVTLLAVAHERERPVVLEPSATPEPVGATVRK